MPEPIEFSLSAPCFACGAQRGEPCRSGEGHRRQYPHFGRVGMPAGRGSGLEMTHNGPVAFRRQGEPS